MTEFEWVQRATMRYANRLGWHDQSCEEFAKTSYDDGREYYENDPEGCVDEDLTNWD